MTSPPLRRCVIWFGQPSQRERDVLAAAGWSIRAADPAGSPGVGTCDDDIVVGLLDLRADCDDGLATIEQLAHCLPLMAIQPDRAPVHPVKQRLLDRCVTVFATPPDTTRLIQALNRIARQPRNHQAGGIHALLGNSPAMLAVHRNIRKYAQEDLTVLITGDTGTGKEIAARALHQLSGRSDRRFAAINCGALPEHLVQTELFGHERGAFTGATARHIGLFEHAKGGTVFLDEIGDLPLEAQTNLLRVLQEGRLARVGGHQLIDTDVRILAATNIDLDKAVAEGRFRSDLFYRLNVLRLHMPRLSERGDDIELLAQHFLDAFRKKSPGRPRSFTPQARAAMRQFSWPGNVRELLSRVQRAAVIADSELITAQDLELADAASSPADESAPADGNGTLDHAREATERDTLRACLRDSGYNVSETARRLKISRVTVYRLCKKHRLELSRLH